MRPLDPRDLDEAVAAVGDWGALDGARLLLTGATGFYGAWLLSTLHRATQARGLRVEAVALTRDVRAARARLPWLGALPWLTLAEGDARSFTPPDGPFTHAVLAATSTTVAPGAREDPFETASVVVDGTRRALDLCAARGVTRLLYASSGAVYGRQPSGLTHVDEGFTGAPDCLDPRLAYGHAKRLGENLCAAAAAERGVAAVVARGFAFVGPYLPLDAHFAIGNFLRDGLAGRAVVVKGDGSPRRSYLYGGDLAAWLWVMLLRGASGRAYNLGSDDDRALSDVASRVAARFGVPVEVRGAPEPDAPRNRYVPSVARAWSELGLDVTVGLDEAIAHRPLAPRGVSAHGPRSPKRARQRARYSARERPAGSPPGAAPADRLRVVVVAHHGDGGEVEHAREGRRELGGQREPGRARAGERAAVGHATAARVHEAVRVEPDDVHHAAAGVEARAPRALGGDHRVGRRHRAEHLRGARVEDHDVAAVGGVTSAALGEGGQRGQRERGAHRGQRPADCDPRREGFETDAREGPQERREGVEVAPHAEGRVGAEVPRREHARDEGDGGEEGERERASVSAPQGERAHNGEGPEGEREGGA
ncbi:MAG: NAD-dependent epimerase/dehydratase family protein [Polyangiales bacterium]